jgi:hypothetical protein
MTWNTITNGTTTDADKVMENFNLVVPIGCVLPWLKSYTNCPALASNFVECNGQTLSDAGSVFNGQVIPNLNGSLGSGLKGYFIRGHSASGVTETSQNLAHNHTYSKVGTGRNAYDAGGEIAHTQSSTNTGDSGGTEARPSNYSVVFIMRVK